MTGQRLGMFVPDASDLGIVMVEVKAGTYRWWVPCRTDMHHPHEPALDPHPRDHHAIIGGGDLAGQFADAGLLDQIIVYLAPVTLGGG